MESHGWLGAVELQQQLAETEQKLTQALDRVADLERVRRQAQTVVREWPGVRDQVLELCEPDLVGFNDRVGYLRQAVEGRSSELPPPPRAPVADQEYLQEVLLELWELVRNPENHDGKGVASETLHQVYQILEQAVEVEAAPTMPDLKITGGVPIILPSGHEWKDPKVHGPSDASKSVEVRRLRCEDDGPEYPDGTDADGFPGGNERMGLPAQTLVGKPVEGHPGIFTVEFSQIKPHVAYQLTLPETPKWLKMEPIPAIDPLRGVIRSEDVNPNWPMGAPKKRPPLPARPRRTEEQEKTFRQLDRDAPKLNEIGREHLEWLRSLRAREIPTTPERIVAEYGGPADGLTLAQRLSRIESALGLDKDD